MGHGEAGKRGAEDDDIEEIFVRHREQRLVFFWIDQELQKDRSLIAYTLESGGWMEAREMGDRDQSICVIRKVTSSSENQQIDAVNRG